MTHAFLRLAILVLAGCAGARWDRPGGTQEDFQRDLAACRMGQAGIPSRQPGPYDRNPAVYTGDSMVDAGVRAQYIDDCLTSRGWRRG